MLVFMGLSDIFTDPKLAFITYVTYHRQYSLNAGFLEKLFIDAGIHGQIGELTGEDSLRTNRGDQVQLLNFNFILLI